MNVKIIKNLKGGSLSKTIIIKKNSKKFVRKLIHIENNREFGFYRWLSQFKKLQRLNKIFPKLFPKVMSSGIFQNYYYFDIEFFVGSKNCYEYFCKEKNIKNISFVFEKIIKNLKKVNDLKYPAVLGSQNIYFKEEIKRRIKLFKDDENGKKFLKYTHYKLNGEIIKNSINKLILWLDNNNLDFNAINECHTHGNITLENILYIPNSKRIIFIDPYEENFVDSSHQEISQLLQSSNSHYELMCNAKLKIKQNSLNAEYTLPIGIENFNKNLNKYINTNFSTNEKKIIKFYEMAQFIRMLPFKLKNEPERAKLFFIVAIRIFNDEINE